jgi:hypothetical protein
MEVAYPRKTLWVPSPSTVVPINGAAFGNRIYAYCGGMGQSSTLRHPCKRYNVMLNRECKTFFRYLYIHGVPDNQLVDGKWSNCWLSHAATCNAGWMKQGSAPVE